MAAEFPLTKQFYASVTNQEYTQRRVFFTVSLPNDDVDFLFSSENDILELVLSKQTLMKIFKECFPVSISYMANRELFSMDNDATLIQLYYMTVGMLLSTHENHTIINIHEQIVEKILGRLDELKYTFPDILLDPKRFILKELSFLQAILNSNNNKLNKSSSLWTLFKKLYIYIIDNSSGVLSNPPAEFFINTALKSAQLHLSNYYAWNFIRFITNVSKLTVGCQDYIKITELMEKYCKSHTSDASAWMCYVDSCQLNIPALRILCSEFNRISKTKKLKVDTTRLFASFPTSNQQLTDLSRWLWDAKVVSEVPYHAFQQLAFYSVKVWREKDLVKELFSQIKIHCALFEELKLKPSNIEVQIFNGYMKTSVDTSNDYELDQLLSTYYNYKKLLNWYDAFLKDKYIEHTP